MLKPLLAYGFDGMAAIVNCSDGAGKGKAVARVFMHKNVWNNLLIVSIYNKNFFDIIKTQSENDFTICKKVKESRAETYDISYR